MLGCNADGDEMTGCPYYCLSNGEKAVLVCLETKETLNVNSVIPQYELTTDLSSKNGHKIILKGDFKFKLIVGNSNIEAVIEYDGTQRFEHVNFGGKTDHWKNMEKRVEKETLQANSLFDPGVSLLRIARPEKRLDPKNLTKYV